MLGKHQVAGVVTRGFQARSSEPLRTAIAELLRLEIGTIYVVRDRKDAHASALVREALAAMEVAATSAGVQLHDMVVDAFETAERWRFGICEALKDPNILAVFNFPGDMQSGPTEVQRAAWRTMRQSADHLLLGCGDFDTDERFKKGFDESVARPVLRIIEPERYGELADLGLKRLRTEFFFCGRGVFEQMDGDPGRTWGPDPTPQLLLAALDGRGDGLAIESVDLGAFRDDPNTRATLGQLHQIVRFAAHTALARIVREKAAARDARATAAAYDRLRHQLDAVFDCCIRAVDRNRRVHLNPEAWERSQAGRKSNEPGVTVVAFLGANRPELFDRYIHWLQGRVEYHLGQWIAGGWLRLVPPDQVHCTLFGLKADQGLVNRNLKKRWERLKANAPIPPMDLGGLTRFLHELTFPTLQFGGFGPEAPNPYDTRAPYDRGFDVRDDGLLVAIGWPVRWGVIQPALFNIRREIEQFHCVHKWHVDGLKPDNDGFLVLGELTARVWQESASNQEAFARSLSNARDAIRHELARRPEGFDVSLEEKHCNVVKYQTADMAHLLDIVALREVTGESLASLNS
jgi:hypothetical protein